MDCHHRKVRVTNNIDVMTVIGELLKPYSDLAMALQQAIKRQLKIVATAHRAYSSPPKQNAYSWIKIFFFWIFVFNVVGLPLPGNWSARRGIDDYFIDALVMPGKNNWAMKLRYCHKNQSFCCHTAWITGRHSIDSIRCVSTFISPFENSNSIWMLITLNG